METRYDPEADAVYFTLGTTDILESEEVAPDVILDFDAENRVVGIEVLHATAPCHGAPNQMCRPPIPRQVMSCAQIPLRLREREGPAA